MKALRVLVPAAVSVAMLAIVLLLGSFTAEPVQAAVGPTAPQGAPSGQQVITYTLFCPLILKGYDPCAGVGTPRIDSPINGRIYRAEPNRAFSLYSEVTDSKASFVEGTIGGGWLTYTPYGGGYWARNFDFPARSEGTKQTVNLTVRNQCRSSTVRFKIWWSLPVCGECSNSGKPGMYDEYGQCIPCCDEPPCECNPPWCDGPEPPGPFVITTTVVVTP